ncbi:MAG: fluoride efflux transporter CrcB [Pirellula sp.]|nr:fluoride efflux transporter CrcB [Pirellula sp.]
MQQVLAVAVGGALGCLCRYGANVACVRWFEAPVFYSTLAVNVVGAFLVGIIAGLPFMQHPVLAAGAAVGFLGGLTTFSTFSIETMRLWETQTFVAAALNITANVVLSLLAVKLGLTTAQLFATP